VGTAHFRKCYLRQLLWIFKEFFVFFQPFFCDITRKMRASLQFNQHRSGATLIEIFFFPSTHQTFCFWGQRFPVRCAFKASVTCDPKQRSTWSQWLGSPPLLALHLCLRDSRLQKKARYSPSLRSRFSLTRFRSLSTQSQSGHNINTGF